MPSGCDRAGPRKRPQSANPLTPSQVRVLRFCTKYPEWHTLLELDSIRLLSADDIVVVPSLIELGYLRHNAVLRAVQITYFGQGAIMRNPV